MTHNGKVCVASRPLWLLANARYNWIGAKPAALRNDDWARHAGNSLVGAPLGAIERAHPDPSRLKALLQEA